MIKKVIIGIVAAIALVGGYFGYRYFGSNVPKPLADPYVNIPTGSDFDTVVELLKSKGFIKDEASFRELSARMKYAKPVMRSGRFKIEEGWSNYDLIRHLRAGEQSPVKVIFNTERLPEEVAGKISKFIEADSLKILGAIFDQSFMDSIGLNKDNILTIFIPNTYETFWNSTPEKFVRRMYSEYQNFWSKNNRKEKAAKLNLTPQQVYALASIVERESQNSEERPTIAGVYLNRLKINMKLQADPTCVFASRDFETRRVTSYHLSFDSPYNTYINYGLPPGPISVASISSLDAVLNPEQHDYLYFCAKADESGTHAFASNLAGHNANVSKYIAWLNAKGIR